MQGVRLPDGTAPRSPGEYAWMPYSAWLGGKPACFTGGGEWHIVDPTGRIGAIRERDGVTRERASEAIWTIHRLVRPKERA